MTRRIIKLNMKSMSSRKGAKHHKSRVSVVGNIIKELVSVPSSGLGKIKTRKVNMHAVGSLTDQ